MDVLAGYGSDSDSDNDTDTGRVCDGPPIDAASTDPGALASSKPSQATGLGSTTRTVTVTRKAASTYAGASASVHGTADSTELPPGWQQCLDPGSSDVYFWNTVTGETSWERPGGAAVSAATSSSLLAAARKEAGCAAADVAAAEEQIEDSMVDSPAEDTETQQTSAEDSDVGADGQPSISADFTVATAGVEDDFAGVEDDFAAAAAAAEEAVKADALVRSAQAEQDVLYLAEVIGTKVVDVLKRLMAAKLNVSKSSVARAADIEPAEPGCISVFPPEPAPDAGSTERERTRFRLLLQVKGMKGTGLAQLWKQRPALEALERLQLLFSASMLAWCKGDLPSDVACVLLESYGCKLARIEEGGLPAGWRCIFHGVAPESPTRDSIAEDIDGGAGEAETSGDSNSMAGFWYCHGRSGRATQTRPQLLESDAADAEAAGVADGDVGEKDKRTSSSQQHQNGVDSVPSGHSQVIPQPPPPPSIEEQTWPGAFSDEDKAVPRPLSGQDSKAMACDPNGNASTTNPGKTQEKHKRKSKVKTGAAGGRGATVAHGKLGKMVEKWTAAKAELVGSSDEEDHDGSEAAQASAARKRARELEEWRLATLKDPGARNNANFQPLQFDWRARVKRTRREDAESIAVDRPGANSDEAAADEETAGSNSDESRAGGL